MVFAKMRTIFSRLIGNKLAVSQWFPRLVLVRLAFSVRDEHLNSRLYALFRGHS